MYRIWRHCVTYCERLLPLSLTKPMAVRAGVSQTWGRNLGLHGKAVCIDRFGISAPGDAVMAALGISAENVAAVASELL